MEVAPSVLQDLVADEFDGLQVETSGDVVIVTDSFGAGFYHPDELEAFEQSLREFILQYTQAWEIDRVSGNRLEGYYRAVLIRSDEN